MAYKESDIYTRQPEQKNTEFFYAQQALVPQARYVWKCVSIGFNSLYETKTKFFGGMQWK